MTEKRKFDKKPTIIHSDNFGKIPPQCMDIEEAVLGTFINNYHYIAKFPYLKPEIFYKDSHQKIYKYLYELYLNDMKPDMLILLDHLRDKGELESVGGEIYIRKLSNQTLSYIDTHVKRIMDKYFYRFFIQTGMELQNDGFSLEKDPLDILNELQEKVINLFEFEMDIQDNFKHTLTNTITDIVKSSQGENIKVIKSGYKQLDKSLTFRTGFVCIVAGPEGSGKTKYVTSIIRGMLDNEPELAVQWFTFEDDREEIIRAFLAMDLHMTTKELQSINYKVKDKDILEINKTAEKYKNYNVEFYDKITSINNIVSRSKRFADKYKDKKRMIVIDNLGLVDCKLTGLERDDHIAGRIKYIASTTDSSIILVHHFTKEISRKANIEDGYRPRKEYLKGSTRILDYVQQALFVNLLRKYPDLLAEERRLTMDFITKKEIEFTEANFDKYLWSINSQRCKETESLTDLRAETLLKLRGLINNQAKDITGNVITFSGIIQKYTEYSNYVNGRNKGREEKYMEKKKSIYIFIVKKMFNETYISDEKSLRSLYLYGNHKNLKHHVDRLFIVESMKNRDDDNLDDNALFRFVVDLGYNLFNEVDEQGNFDKSIDKPKK